MTSQNPLLNTLDAVLLDSRLLALASASAISMSTTMHTLHTTAGDPFYTGTPWSIAWWFTSTLTTVFCIQNTHNHIRWRWPNKARPEKTAAPEPEAQEHAGTPENESPITASLVTAGLTAGLNAIVGNETTLVLAGAIVCLLLNIMYMDGKAKLEGQTRANLKRTLQELRTKFQQGRVNELPAIKRIQTERNDRHEVTAITGETTHPDGTRTTLKATIAPDGCSGRSLAAIKIILGPASPPRTTAQLAWLNEDTACWIGRPYKTPKRGNCPTLTIRRTAASALLEAMGQGPVILTNGTATCGVRLPPADRTTVEAFRRKHAEEAGD